jgi:signal transduction histidine kinase/DNA-binding response OmpR family regulator
MKNLRNTVVLLFCSFLASAQKAEFEFYNVANGLSGNFTPNVVQDDQGLIWLVNDYKLHRFDGRNFVRYPLATQNASLSLKRLRKIDVYEDSLLLLVSETELFLFNPRTDIWQSISLPFVQSKDFTLQKIYRNSYYFLVYTEEYKLHEIWRFRNRRFEKMPFGNIPMNYGKRLPEIDASGNLYVLLSNTIIKRALTGRQIAAFAAASVCGDCEIVDFLLEHTGDLLLLVQSGEHSYGVYVLKAGSTTFTPHPLRGFVSRDGKSDRVKLFSDDKRNLWLLDLSGQLAYYHAAQDTTYRFEHELAMRLHAPDIFNFVPDRTGTVWLPTRLGLIKLTLQAAGFDQYFAQPIPNNGGYYSFRGIAEDAQGTVYASFYGGMARLDPNHKKALPFVTTADTLPLPWGLYATGQTIFLNNGHLLHAPTGKITVLPGASDSNDEAGLFSKAKDGRLWWVHNQDLFYLEQTPTAPRWKKVLELPFMNKYFTEAIHAGQHSGQLWISHRGRLLRYSPEDGKQKWFDTKDWKLPVSRIMVIEESADGWVWLGTDVGLVQFDPATDQTKNYTEKDGLCNNFVCGMLPEGDSCLWLSTNIGLSRFHIASKSFINFFEEDGLSHNEFNRLSYFKSRNGRMFFGGLRGINAFFPQELMQAYRRRNEAAQLALSSFEYVDERRDTTFRQYNFDRQPTVKIRDWHRSFTFEYVLTDFAHPEEISYSYQMEGYEDTWSTPSRFNFTRFSSLPPGKYTFRVKARDGHGLWHPHRLAVQVVVYPPWWQTTGAYLAYVLLLSGAAYLVYQFLKKRWLLRHELRLKAEEARQLKELDGFKNRLYTNLTHEFRTPLTVILGMAQQLRSDPPKYLDPGTRLIENNGKNLLRLINQLLDLSKLENQSFELKFRQGDIVPYLRYLTESFQTFANSKNLSLRFFTNLESLVMDYDEAQLQQVLTNLISNALKFTPPDGNILVRVTRNDQQLHLEVHDTGIGIAAKDLPHVFDRFYQAAPPERYSSPPGAGREGAGGTGIGLAHTLELVKLMGGSITVESEVGKGSRFCVQLPIRNDAPFYDTSPLERTPLISTFELSSNGSSESSTLQSKTENLPQLLLIEDNQDVVVYLKSCLEGLYQLQVAYNGKIGVDKAFEHIPDLIISDVMMPEMDGYEVCDTLKNDERTSHIPLILLTAKADMASKIIGLRRGADAYLTKPFDKEELLVQLEILVEKQKRMVAHFSKQLSNKNLEQADIPEEGIQIEDAFMQKVRQIVAENYHDEDFGLPQLCQKLRMSRSQLFRKMQALAAVAPSDFIRTYRLEQAKTLLQTTDLQVSEVAWQVGFKDLAHFSKTFQDAFGFSPSATSK